MLVAGDKEKAEEVRAERDDVANLSSYNTVSNYYFHAVLSYAQNHSPTDQLEWFRYGDMIFHDLSRQRLLDSIYIYL